MTAASINTRRTIERRENLRTLIAHFKRSDLCRDDIREILEVSPGGARNYINALGDLLHATCHGNNVQRTYQLTGDQARIDAFLAVLGETVELTPRPRRSATAAALADPTRHIHMLADDAPFRVPVCRVAPAHTELHARFFGGVA